MKRSDLMRVAGLDRAALANRWAKPWGDKARAASLAVRQAKAAARAASSPGAVPGASAGAGASESGSAATSDDLGEAAESASGRKKMTAPVPPASVASAESSATVAGAVAPEEPRPPVRPVREPMPTDAAGWAAYAAKNYRKEFGHDPKTDTELVWAEDMANVPGEFRANGAIVTAADSPVAVPADTAAEDEVGYTPEEWVAKFGPLTEEMKAQMAAAGAVPAAPADAASVPSDRSAVGNRCERREALANRLLEAAARRLGNRWSDAARVASLAARRAKALGRSPAGVPAVAGGSGGGRSTATGGSGGIALPPGMSPPRDGTVVNAGGWISVMRGGKLERIGTAKLLCVLADGQIGIKNGDKAYPIGKPSDWGTNERGVQVTRSWDGKYMIGVGKGVLNFYDGKMRVNSGGVKGGSGTGGEGWTPFDQPGVDIPPDAPDILSRTLRA